MTAVSTILDFSHKIFFSKVKLFLFKEFLSLSPVRIIWIIGLFFIFIYLYNIFVSSKRLLRIAKNFDSLFGDFMDFISSVYDSRHNPSKKDKTQYLLYYDKFRPLFSTISYPLLKYLEGLHKDKNQSYSRVILYNIGECFSSPNLDEHFKKKRSKPPEEYIQFKHIIEEFIGYLKYKK